MAESGLGLAGSKVVVFDRANNGELAAAVVAAAAGSGCRPGSNFKLANSGKSFVFIPAAAAAA